jgi:hypothetical protein
VRGTTFAHRDGGRVVTRHRPRQRLEAIYRDRRDRPHFLEMLAKMVPRFRVRLRVLVLMDNHYDLLPEFAEANLSRTVQCLNVGCSVRYGDPGRGMAPYLGERRACAGLNSRHWQRRWGCGVAAWCRPIPSDTDGVWPVTPASRLA